MKCKNCGCEMSENELAEKEDEGDDEHMDAQKAVIDELLGIMKGSLTERLMPKKKPIAMSVEMIAAKPKGA